jgi:VanZ family protein
LLRSLTRTFVYWFPALLWLAVIALESFRLSSAVTGTFLWELLRWLHIHMSPRTFARFHHLLRKGGHVAGYGILCLLLFRAWFHTLSMRGMKVRCAALALSMTFLTAVLDEYHQSFDPSRTASVRDVGLDVTGGILFLIVALFVFRGWRSAPVETLETVPS